MIVTFLLQAFSPCSLWVLIKTQGYTLGYGISGFQPFIKTQGYTLGYGISGFQPFIKTQGCTLGYGISGFQPFLYILKTLLACIFFIFS